MPHKLHACPVTPQEMGKVWNFTRATPLLHQVRAKHHTSHIAKHQTYQVPVKHSTHKHIANTYDQVPVKHHTHTHMPNTYAKCSKHSKHQVPVKHHNIPLLHIDRSRGVIVINKLQWRYTTHSPIQYTR